MLRIHMEDDHPDPGSKNNPKIIRNTKTVAKIQDSAPHIKYILFCTHHISSTLIIINISALWPAFWILIGMKTNVDPESGSAL